MQPEKYTLTDIKKTLKDGTIVYRIQAIKDFGDVKAGDLGGWVQSYKNLSQIGECWLYNDAIARDSATVQNAASLYDYSIARDYATVCQNAVVTDRVVVEGHATVSSGLHLDRVVIGGHAVVEGCTAKKAKIRGDVRVDKKSLVSGNLVIEGNEWIPSQSAILNQKDFLFLHEDELDITAVWSSSDMVLLGVKSKSGEEAVVSIEELDDDSASLLIRSHPEVFDKIRDVVSAHFKKHTDYFDFTSELRLSFLVIAVLTLFALLILFGVIPM